LIICLFKILYIFFYLNILGVGNVTEVCGLYFCQQKQCLLFYNVSFFKTTILFVCEKKPVTDKISLGCGYVTYISSYNFQILNGHSQLSTSSSSYRQYWFAWLKLTLTRSKNTSFNLVFFLNITKTILKFQSIYFHKLSQMS